MSLFSKHFGLSAALGVEVGAGFIDIAFCLHRLDNSMVGLCFLLNVDFILNFILLTMVGVNLFYLIFAFLNMEDVLVLNFLWLMPASFNLGGDIFEHDLS